MKEVNQLILEIKKGNEDVFEELLERFMPLINKYSRLLYKDDPEDIKAELYLALFDAINKMKYYDDEANSIAYITKSLYLKYLELYRKSKQYHEHTETLEDKFIEIHYVQEDLFQEVEVYNDLERLICRYNNQTYNILSSILFEQLSDSEIAEKYNVTRQYVNRKRHELFKLLQEQYL